MVCAQIAPELTGDLIEMMSCPPDDVLISGVHGVFDGDKPDALLIGVLQDPVFRHQSYRFPRAYHPRHVTMEALHHNVGCETSILAHLFHDGPVFVAFGQTGKMLSLRLDRKSVV